MAGLSRGAEGEVLAARFLREKGYEILTANYACRFGEIDIIARDGRYIAFVEVKTRGEAALYTPREAVTAEKRRRLVKTALLFLQAHHAEVETLCGAELQPRFDVIEVYTASRRPLEVREINHIVGAYDAGDCQYGY